MFIKRDKDLDKFCRGCLGQQAVVDMNGASCKGVSVIEMYLKVTNTKIEKLPGQLKLCISCTSVLYQTYKFLKMINKSLMVLTLTDRALNEYKKFDHTYARSGVNLEDLNNLKVEDLTKMINGETVAKKRETLKLKFEDSVIELNIPNNKETDYNTVSDKKLKGKKKVSFKYRSFREFLFINKTIRLLKENLSDISEKKDQILFENLLKHPNEIWPNRNIITDLLKKYNTNKKTEHIVNNIKTEVTEEIVEQKAADSNNANVATEARLKKEVIVDDDENMDLEVSVGSLSNLDPLFLDDKFTLNKKLKTSDIPNGDIISDDLFSKIKSELAELDTDSDTQAKDNVLDVTHVSSKDKNKSSPKQTGLNKQNTSKQLPEGNAPKGTCDLPLIKLSDMPQRIAREICLICDEIVYLEEHMQKVHRVIWESKQCARCQKDFSTFNDLISHCQSEDHSDLKCHKCNEKYDAEESFLRHVSLRVCQKNIRTAENKKRKRKRQLVPENKKVKLVKFGNLSCNKCESFTATTFKDMFAHFQCEHPEERSCLLCEESYQFRETVLTHLAVHSKKTYCSTHFMAFDTTQQLKEHVQMKNHNRMCIECDNLVFEDRRFYMRHRKSKHLPDDKIKCPQCPLIYERATNLNRHILRFHEKVKIMCDQCGNSYTNNVSLRAHKAKVHDGIDIESKSELACCEDCGKTFCSHYTMCLHKIRDHGLHLCWHCRLGFADEKLLEEHIKQTGHEHYECKTCQKSYTRKVMYIHHLETHKDSNEDDPNLRNVAPRRKKQHSNIYFRKRKAFEYSVNANNRYPCSVCTRDFKTLAIMKLHKSLHFPVKPFKCEICGKSFRIKRFCEEHMNTHTGNRPHQCQYCDKSFLTNSSRYQHEAIHTGRRPHTCPVCSKGFITSSGLRKHVQIHMKDGRSKAQLESLVAHTKPKIQIFATKEPSNIADLSRRSEAKTKIIETKTAVAGLLDNSVERQELQEDPLIYY